MRNAHAWDEVSNRQWDGEWLADYEPWSLDFSTVPPREYKEDRGMRVYRNGMVELRSLGVRNPYQRADMLNRYGMWFDSPRKEGLRFTTPEGEHVSKDSIQESLLFFSKKHGVALAGNSSTPITLYSEHAFPVSTEPVRVDVPDKEKVDKVLSLHKDVLKAAAVECALQGRTFIMRSGAKEWARYAMTLSGTYVPFTNDEQRLSVGYYYHKGLLRAELSKQYKLTHKHPFLRFTQQEV